MAAGDVIKVLRGIAGNILSIGLGSTKVQLKNNSGALEARNNTDAAYVIGRGLDPVGDDDWVTKRYGDANYSGEATAEKIIQFSITTTTASSTATIPAGAQVLKAEIDITTPYSAGATLDLGDGTTADLIFDDTELDVEAANNYYKDQNTDWPLGTAVTATVGGAPGAGAATITVWYAQPAA